jgi:hypothetical protein
MKNIFFAIVLTINFTGCTGEDEAPSSDVFWANWTPFESQYDLQELEKVGLFREKGEALGVPSLLEASGLAYSRKNPGHIWSHQDWGNDNRIFLLDARTAETVAEYVIPGVFNRDWEDMEIGPGPLDGIPYIYLGDVGDNSEQFLGYSIYRFEEPKFEEEHRGKRVTLDMPFDRIDFSYPDKSHDVEALMVDPLTRDIYLATKRDDYSMLFVAPYPQQVEESFKVKYVGSFGFTRALAGTVSIDGQELLIKNDDRIFYWQRRPGEHFAEMLSRTPKLAPYDPVEVQGEAICFGPAGEYFTLSEFKNGIVPVLYHYPKK